MSRFLALAACLALLPAPLRADPDGEASQPYKLRIVLRIADNRLLTPVFRDRVKRELHDGFQAALGPLAKVQVVDRADLQRAAGDPARTLDLLKLVERDGLQRALDTWTQLSDVKTHFVLIDYADGRYEVQARQYDGEVGLASPAVRRTQTPDRDYVARAAGLLIEHDFGAVGVLPRDVPDADDESAPRPGGVSERAAAVPARAVKLPLKAGRLGGPLGHWVEPGDLFAVAEVFEGAARTRRLEDTLLQVTAAPEHGSCRCQVLSRYQDPLKPLSSRLIEFRCLKLGTTALAPRLRLVAEDRAATPLVTVQVAVGATRDGKPDESKVTNEDGVVEFDRTFRRVAFAHVYQSVIPLALTDDRLALVRVNPGGRGSMPFSVVQLRGYLLGVLNEEILGVNQLVTELNQLLGRQKNDEALERAKQARDALQERLKQRKADLDELRQTSGAAGAGTTDVERRLHDLEGRAKELTSFVKGLEKVVNREKDPKRKALLAKIEQARNEVRLADFDKAIALYEQVLQEAGGDPAFKRYAEPVDKLKKAWEIKGEKHFKARRFILDTWAKATTVSQLKDQVDEARKAFEVCKEVHDVLTPRVILRADAAHATLLEKEFEANKGDQSPDGRKTLEAIQAVSDKLKKLEEDVRAYLAVQPSPL